MKGLTTAWFIYLGVATYQWEKHNDPVLPPPAIYVGSSLVFAGLGIVGEAAPGFADAFAWALVVAAGVSGAFNQIGAVPSPMQRAGAAQTVDTQRQIATAHGNSPRARRKRPADVGPPKKSLGGLLNPTPGKGNGKKKKKGKANA